MAKPKRFEIIQVSSTNLKAKFHLEIIKQEEFLKCKDRSKKRCLKLRTILNYIDLSTGQFAAKLNSILRTMNRYFEKLIIQLVIALQSFINNRQAQEAVALYKEQYDQLQSYFFP